MISSAGTNSINGKWGLPSTTFITSKSGAGFTIIELMVAASVFLILVALSTTIFIQTLRTQRTINTVTAANESASQALEQIARDARTGYNFTVADKNMLIFTSSNAGNKTVGYELINNSIGRCFDTYCSGSAPKFDPITPKDVFIEELNFITQPQNITSGVPRITILITVGSVSDPKLVGTASDIQTHLETTVSSRNFSK